MAITCLSHSQGVCYDIYTYTLITYNLVYFCHFFHFQFIVSPGSVVDFIGNKARVSGGGIMVDSPVVDHARNFLNRFCFVRFRDPDIPPQEWKVSGLEV